MPFHETFTSFQNEHYHYTFFKTHIDLSSPQNSRLTVAEKATDGDLLDMFADDFEDTVDSKNQVESGKDSEKEADVKEEFKSKQ